MNVIWALNKLDDLQNAIDDLREARVMKDSEARRAAERRVETLKVPVTAIANQLFHDWHWPQGSSAELLNPRIQQLRGTLLYEEEISKNLHPETPRLHAEQLHPWVWKGAVSLWQSGHYADAVGGAAKMVNAELQNKVGRRDISDAHLCAESFSLKDADPKTPRLRFSGDRSSESWRARQEGAVSFSRGAFMAVRNPIAHQNSEDIAEHNALELLAIFSVISRWVEECFVENSPPPGP